MNGYSQTRIGGTGPRASLPVARDALHTAAFGMQSPGQMFGLTFMRHMHDYGTTLEHVAMVKVIHSEHASNNPKAFYNHRVTVHVDVLNSKMIFKSLHLLDCCVETDNATAITVSRPTARRIAGIRWS